MAEKSVESKIMLALNNIGVELSDHENMHISMQELIVDSLQYIGFIVELEGLLQVEMPDDFLLNDGVSTIESFVHAVDQYMESLPASSTSTAPGS